VDDGGRRVEPHAPAGLAGPPAQVHVLVIQKVRRVQPTQGGPAVAADQHAAAGGPSPPAAGPGPPGASTCGCGAATRAASACPTGWGRSRWSAAASRPRGPAGSRPPPPSRPAGPGRTARSRTVSRKSGGAVMSGLSNKSHSPRASRQPSLTARAKPRLTRQRNRDTPGVRRRRGMAGWGGEFVVDDDELGEPKSRRLAGAQLAQQARGVVPPLVVHQHGRQARPSEGRGGG
jgi:hypothetical protein